MSKMHIKKDDKVIVISGKYAKTTGKVIAVSPDEGKVIVEGVHIVSKHVKPRRQGEAGGIIKTEGAIYACKVMLYCDSCKKGVRVRHQKDSKGERIRVCTKCGQQI